MLICAKFIYVKFVNGVWLLKIVTVSDLLLVDPFMELRDLTIHLRLYVVKLYPMITFC